MRIALFWIVVSIVAPASADEKRVLEQVEQSRSRYATAESWAGRRAELREGFLRGAGLWPMPDRPAPRFVIHSRRDHDGYSVENVALETMPGFYCTGNLYRPRGRADRGPAILCPHGHFRPLGRFREDQQVRCAAFARMGATVFSYSMVGWQDSRQTTHDDPLVLALQTWNSLRVLDFLAVLPEVDPRRIGITGASGGGSQTLFLAALDDRVRVSAPVVIVYPWTAPDGCRCEGGLPVMQNAATNAIELAASVAPRPQLLISVGNDPTQDFPKNAFPFIQHVYAIHGHPDLVKNLHLAGEAHDFGPSKRKAVYAFFAEHLGMTLRDEDLSAIRIETAEAMEAFNAEHPLPARAVHGSEEVAKAFQALKSSNAATQSGDENYLFSPAGFDRAGEPAVAKGDLVGHLAIEVRDGSTGELAPCRINVVGSDGQFYQPAENRLTPYSLTGVWPTTGRGNRPGKAPIRYYGRFFYSTGKVSVDVPAGPVRVEVWKGFERRPESRTTRIEAGQTIKVPLTLTRTLNMDHFGYASGDPHIHLKRQAEADDELILDLMQAEDIRYASILAYNEPAGPYTGLMDRMDTPQFRGLGARSIRTRGDYHILSGQEYRSGTYGHLNLFLRDNLVLEGQSLNADNWPLYGALGRETQKAGGYAFYAHGGYAQAILADFVQGDVNGVELLQFGVYRGIGLEDWYRMLSIGYRFPCIGASDYPACRALGDCRTYVQHNAGHPEFADWLRGAAKGRSFVTTGPMLLLEVDGAKPGGHIAKAGNGPHRVSARVRVISEVAPVTNVHLIVNGRTIDALKVPASEGHGNWLELNRTVELKESSWIAARAFSASPSGSPDAEAHTNPVYVDLNGKAPYNQSDLDRLVERIDGQMTIHRARDFAEKSKVLDYFQKSRDILLRIRARGGLPAEGVPPAILEADAGALADPGARTHSDEQLKAFLKPLPPKTPAESLASFETAGGFRMELVASEPLVCSPVAAAFDENGNLYVAEMRDYPFRPKPGQQPIGTVRLLRDTDGDGRFDHADVFADGLLWAAGIAPWKGGIFVAAPPDIWYFKDTNGDHKADVRERVFTGFGVQNQQGMLNNLVYGLDHKIYGSTSSNGGIVRPGNDPRASGIKVDGRDFRFDPATRVFETITGTRQFGNTFDDWGNRFLCSESLPLLHPVLPEHYLARNPYLPVPSAIDDIASGSVPIYRISPIERWRQIRSSRRIAHGERSATSAGASHHVVDAGAGVTVYRGGAYPPEYYGNVFLGDAQNNLIHRRTLTAAGPTFQSRRADEKTEFVRSADNWFRPVNLLNAPDGTLYVLDISRETLEAIHIPLDVVKHLDLRRGRDQGRIYRIAPPAFRSGPPPRLGAATTSALVAALERPHGWWRDTAHRLLHERQDRAAVEPLRRLLASSALPQARVLALWSLDGLNALTDADRLASLRDTSPRVREHAIRLAESRLDASPEILRSVLAQTDDPDGGVRFQLAFSLGESRDPRAVSALVQLARRDAANPWCRTAILSSSAEHADRLLDELLRDPELSKSGAGSSLIEPLALVVGARQRAPEIRRLVEAVATGTTANDPTLQDRILLGLGRGLKQAGGRLAVSAILARAQATAADTAAGEARRTQAIELLGCAPFAFSAQTLAALLDARQSEAVQLAALRALADYPDDEAAAILLEHFTQFAPTVRTTAVQALLSREAWTLALLGAAKSGSVTVNQVEPARRQALIGHRNPDVARLARDVFGGDVASPRKDVLAAYASVLTGNGDPARGAQIFQRQCMTCHKIGGQGFATGPDLTSSPSRDPATLLTHILDPNQYVLPSYVQYFVTDKEGRTYSGLIADETATSLTLKRGDNAHDTLQRTQIDEIKSTGQSLMPEGFEKSITKPEMADLIAYLVLSHGAGGPEPPLDRGTDPGSLVEPCGE